MDCTQRAHEQAVGDRFVRWYNEQHHAAFVFVGRPDGAPDLTYRDDHRELNLEITDCYYDADDATVKWMNARQQRNAPTEWTGMNFDASLIESVNSALRHKCTHRYGIDCLLVVNVSPALTTAEEMAELLHGITILKEHCWKGIYLAGTFGDSSDGSIGGCRVWELYPRPFGATQ